MVIKKEFYGVIQEQNPLLVLVSDIKRKIKFRAFKRITKKSLNLFLRSKDIISIGPLIDGAWEPDLALLINKFSEQGHSDFLIDIGANIGLTSCQSGNRFTEVFMYEPNPLCCHILAVNTAIALTEPIFKIHQFGLGVGSKIVKLTVPKNNWGGAFINDSSNSYGEKLLADKDGFESIDPKNYLEIEIVLKDTEVELKKLFEELSEKNLKLGVIKIDVEGYELEILKGIALALPRSFGVYIVFESWDKDFPIDKVLADFNREIQLGKIVTIAPWKKNLPKLFKAISLLMPRKFIKRVSPIEKGELDGDIVLYIK